MQEEEADRRASQSWQDALAPSTSQPPAHTERHDAQAQPPQQPQFAQQNGALPPFSTLPQMNIPTGQSDANSQMLQILQQQMIAQQQQMAQQQQILMQLLRQRNDLTTGDTGQEKILDSLCGHIKEFRYDVETGATFAAWYKRYEDLFQKDAARLDDEAKVRLLLRKLGTSEHDRYTNYILPKHPREYILSETVSKLTALFGTKESLLHKRFRCLKLTKLRSEDFVMFACRVNRGAVDFELGKLTEEQFKCLVFVCGIKEEEDADFRTRLLRRIEEQQDVTLDQLSAECQRMTNLRHDSDMIKSDKAEKVLAIKENTHRQDRPPNKNQFNEASKPSRPCWLCGSPHWTRECTFRTHKCTQCGVIGHREGYCNQQNKLPQRTRPFVKYANMRSVTINVHNIRDRRKYVNIKLNGSQVRLQLDTGSDISVISRDLWKKIGSPQLTPPSVIAKSASGDKLGILGEFEANVEVSQKKRQAVIYVVESELALLGTDLAEIFSLWSSPIDEFCNNISSATIAPEAILRKFPLLFQPCMGICTKAAITLHLKPDGRPVFSPKRPVAFAMREAVEAELDRLQKLNVITPVEYSEWAAPIVVVRKSNGKLRICGDYSTGLNAALHPHDYPLPLPEDIFAKLGKSTIFSQIDLSDAFLQVPIAEQSRQMLTINTHKGLYLYNRLPPGIKVAPGAFQQLMDQMLAGMEGVSCYMDDIIVGGRTQNEHDELLSETLKRIQEYGFTIRSDKCSFNKNQVRYLGHIIDKHGIQPDPAKVAVIKDLPPPHDIAGVRSFLGAINYYGRFIPNMRSLRYPLDNLLKNDTTFNWSPECQKVFEQFKSLLATDLLLTHYDPGREIIVSADASSVGLGATISHKFPDGSYKVVQHASRALTKAETNYSQIDREGLAIIFAVTKFHKYIFGRHFCLQTDHKPLLRIFGSKKGIPIYTANRLQRFALTLQLYDFDIQYVSTHNFGNADILSRLIKRHDKLNEDYIIASISLEDDIRSVAVNSLTPFVLSFREVENATKTDPVLQKVARYIKEGWPRNSIFNGDLARFYARKDALSIVDNGILFGERVIIPTALRQRCLRQLHHGHPGVQRMKSLARSYVYWPYLDKEITELVANCGACAAAAKSPPHSIPAPWNEATAPWQRVHIDYAGPIDGYSFLIAVDSFSKWPEIIRTASTTSTATVRILRSLFSRYGNPITLVSDNGRQFISAEFEDFCTTNGIDHLTTAPFHPQSNGQAERFVDTFKRAIKKISSDGTTIEDALEIFLGTYRSTPNPQVPEQKAPATIMFGRQIRTCLELIRPVPRSEVKDNIEPHRSFVRDDLVYAKLYARNGWKWIPGRVISKCGNVMYSVMTNDQKIIRSHINQLRRRTADNTNSMEQRLLPMDILLDAWNLPSSSVAASTAQSFSGDPISQPSGSCSNTPNSSTPPATPIPSSSVPMDAAVPSSSQPVEPHSPSSPSNRSGHQQGSCETEQQLPPRHSSRDRRAPRWLDPYLLS